MLGLLAKWSKLVLPSLGPRLRLSMASAIRPRRVPSVIVFLDLRSRPKRSVCIYLVFQAIKVGVPVVPGTPGPVDSYTDADAFIKEYGFPGMKGKDAVTVVISSHLFSRCSHYQGGYGRRRPWYACCP